MRFLVAVVFLVAFIYEGAIAQCCSAGSGSPVAGGASQGVLKANQVEVNTNLQYIYSTKFYEGDKPVKNFLDHFSSSYLYSRLAYGITEDFTMSVETGYFFQKKQVELNEMDAVQSSGISDLIIFPRYRILDKGGYGTQLEWTVGMGWKIPLGTYNDSAGFVEPFLDTIYYVSKPLAVQLSSGSNDFIFYSFLYRAFSQKFRMFTTAMYIKKGWNPLGEKLGDFATVGLSASRSLSKKVAVNLQLRGESIGQMEVNPDILMYAYPDYDPEATGSKKLFLIPDINYRYKDAAVFYLAAEFPIYQYLNNTQIGSQYQVTMGVSYKFQAFKEKENPDDSQK